MELMDDIKVEQDEREEEKESIRKGDLAVLYIPEHEVDELPLAPKPTKEQLGRYQSVGTCKGCGAHIYVEEYRASKVVRPTLIYTCEPDICWASFDNRDVKWSPRLFGVAEIGGK